MNLHRETRVNFGNRKVAEEKRVRSLALAYRKMNVRDLSPRLLRNKRKLQEAADQLHVKETLT